MAACTNMNQLNKAIKDKLFKERESKQPYIEYLRGFYKFYRDLVKESVDSNFLAEYLPKGTDMDLVNQEILNRTTVLLNAYRTYSEGKIGTAIQYIKNKFICENIADGHMKIYELGHNEDWYRVRLLSTNSRRFEPKEMFHIPFEKRTDVVNYRFSISGYPCLYLGSTILSCWEEMRTPALDDLAISRLNVSSGSTVKVIDLRLPSCPKVLPLFGEPSDDKKRKMNLDLLYSWPLIISCSIKTITPDASFKHEYVHPQLLMLALIESTRFYGVAYTSTHMDPYMSEDEDDYCNVAIPARKVNPKGLCPELSKLFTLTRGVPFMEMDVKNAFSVIPVVKEEILAMPDPTSQIKFKQAEGYLKTIKLESIQE